MDSQTKAVVVGPTASTPAGTTVSIVKNRNSWGPAVAALTLGVLAIAIFVLFFYGVRGIF